MAVKNIPYKEISGATIIVNFSIGGIYLKHSLSMRDFDNMYPMENVNCQQCVMLLQRRKTTAHYKN